MPYGCATERFSLIATRGGTFLAGLFLAGPLLFTPAAVDLWQRITLATAGAWTTVVALRLCQLASPVAARPPTVSY